MYCALSIITTEVIFDIYWSLLPTLKNGYGRSGEGIPTQHLEFEGCMFLT